MAKRELILKRKTGFKITDKNTPIIINDYRGKVFYDNSKLTNVDLFNLPIGKYYIISGNFEALEYPVNYKLNRLPLPERIKAFPFDFEIVFGPNPYKCTINWVNKTILFDKQLLNLSLPELYFILFHEFAHSKFKSEHLTDSLAENMMLKKGFNPSQISSAPITSLSSKQHVRKKEVIKRFFNRQK